MGIEKECFPSFFQVTHEVLYHLASDRIEPTHRLIEKYELRVMQYRLREADPLEHPFRICIQTFFASMSESDLFEDNIFSLLERFPMESIECTIEVEEFISREVFVEVGILGHESDPFPHGNIIDRTSEELHVSEGRLHDTEDTLHGRRLPGTIWAEKSEYFPLSESEVDIIEEKCFSDVFREMAYLDDGVASRTFFWYMFFFHKGD